jgi:hypothetical protein
MCVLIADFYDDVLYQQAYESANLRRQCEINDISVSLTMECYTMNDVSDTMINSRIGNRTKYLWNVKVNSKSLSHSQQIVAKYIFNNQSTYVSTTGAQAFDKEGGWVFAVQIGGC